jgi:hypothetical protein
MSIGECAVGRSRGADVNGDGGMAAPAVGFSLLLPFAAVDADALEPPATPSPFFAESELLPPFVDFFPLSFFGSSR